MNFNIIKDGIKRNIWGLKVNSKRNLNKYNLLIEECSKYKRCFIVGTGPSLTKEDLKKIDDECIFVSNRFLMFGNEFHPTAYFCQDSTVLSNLIDDINNYHSAKFKLLNSYALKLNNKIKKDENTIFYNVDRKRYLRKLPPLFYTKVLDYSDGYTVTYSMIQAAVSLGFKEIYLLGIDFNYQLKTNGEIDSEKSYSKDLNSKNTSLGSPDLDYNLLSYRKAQEFALANNIHIYNATRGGKLEVFERVKLESVINS